MKKNILTLLKEILKEIPKFYSTYDKTWLNIDRLFEFIQDANSKNDIEAEFEIGYFHPNKVFQKFTSNGMVKLNEPYDNYITFEELNFDRKIIISPQFKNIKLFGNYIPSTDEVCILELHDKNIKKIIYLGIVSYITIGLDHGVTISVDDSGSDWTGYIGGIILSD